MVDTVADQVYERIANLFEDGFVELRLLTCELQLDLFAQALREIAHHPWEAAEYHVDGQHAYAHYAFLQLAHVAFELREARAELLGGGAFELGAKLTQHRLGDDELAHGVHQLVDLLDTDTDGRSEE